MRYIIVDLEATCWEVVDRKDMEIIEIGAVVLSPNKNLDKEFTAFVRPIMKPILSDYCKKLTTISQKDVDSAETFNVVFPKFLQWIGIEPFYLCSWGLMI